MSDNMGLFLTNREETTPRLHQKLGRQVPEHLNASILMTQEAEFFDDEWSFRSGKVILDPESLEAVLHHELVFVNNVLVNRKHIFPSWRWEHLWLKYT
jgi:hypothetical protein